MADASFQGEGQHLSATVPVLVGTQRIWGFIGDFGRAIGFLQGCLRDLYGEFIGLSSRDRAILNVVLPAYCDWLIILKATAFTGFFFLPGGFKV